jgi:hypothetical protein
VECVSAEQGKYFSDFLAKYDGSVVSLPQTPTPDNTNGKFPSVDTYKGINLVLTGALGPNSTQYGPTGSGSVYILHMTVKSGANGTVNFKLADVLLGDNSAETNDLKPSVTNGTVTITP